MQSVSNGVRHKPWRVLVVEDDPMVLHIHRTWIKELPQFCVAAYASSGEDVLRGFQNHAIDLVVLDLGLQGKLQGLQLLERFRQDHLAVDVIVVTASRDTADFESALRLGVSDYLIKPFVKQRFQTALHEFEQRRWCLLSPQLSQIDIDRMQRVAQRNGPTPKGIAPVTLRRIVNALQSSREPRSTTEIAEEVGLSRIVTRRYLEHLRDTGKAVVDHRYGALGRPTNLYKLPRFTDT